MRDIFYSINHLTLTERKALIKFAKENSLEWWVDELDCNKSYAKQNIDISFDEIIKKLTSTSHLVVVNRHYSYGEIAFCTFEEPDYFLWINVDIDVLHEITKKFRLSKQ